MQESTVIPKLRADEYGDELNLSDYDLRYVFAIIHRCDFCSFPLRVLKWAGFVLIFNLSYVVRLIMV